MYDSYNNLLKSRQFILIRIEGYHAELLYLQKLARLDGSDGIKGINYENTRVQETKQILYTDYLRRCREIDNHLFLHEQELERVNKEIKAIEKIFIGLEGNKYKICYLRYVEEKKIDEIVEIVGCCKQTVHNVLKKARENSII